MEQLNELRVLLHEEDGSYWAEVPDLPGCFASGQTLDELVEALTEAVLMYVDDNLSGDVTIEREPQFPPEPLRVDELRVALPRKRSKVPA